LLYGIQERRTIAKIKGEVHLVGDKIRFKVKAKIIKRGIRTKLF
jgi:hypothetical protein